LLKTHFTEDCCREKMRNAINAMDFLWKKYRKLLNKADPKKREEFVKKLAVLLKDATDANALIIYMNKRIFIQMRTKSMARALKGSAFGSASCLPGLKNVSFDGMFFK